jgi:succinate dehydrogenase / fumarate reductase, cytochrome b subunit
VKLCLLHFGVNSLISLPKAHGLRGESLADLRAMSERPLSPFLLYRFTYTMVLSFVHRLTGLFVSVGALLLVYGLVALAGDARSFEHARVFFRHWMLQLAMLGLTVAFFYHLSNGVRHLFWDIGWGFEKTQARRSGWLVVASTLVLTALAMWIALQSAGAA